LRGQPLLNGERNTFSEAPNCLATTWKREVENFVRADETSIESSTVTALCDVAAIAER